MIIHSIFIKEGMNSKTFSFSETANLIHSKENSRGKTTLLRFLLYSLGYNIPSTRKIKLNYCEVTTKLFSEHAGEITLFRFNEDFLVATINNKDATFILPEQLVNLHALLFGTENSSILSNLLGTFYIDQEKGWTLLNRGVVIGSLRFNIEELIRGLSNRDCSEEIKTEQRILRDRDKYRQMFSVAQYRETIAEKAGEIVVDSYEESMNHSLSQLKLNQVEIKNNLARIDRTLSDNRTFKRFIADMKIMIQTPDGSVVPVTSENIIGLNDTIEFLATKRKMLSGELLRISKEIDRVQVEMAKEDEQLSFYQSDSMIEIFDKKIISIPMNPVAIDKQIKKCNEDLRAIRDIIQYKTKKDNPIISSIYKNILKYAEELGLGDSSTIATSYLFTSNLKELSGAILHKTVFAFRLAFILEVEKYLKIKLPIILDSPSGKEVDQKNISLMIKILERDFADHQLIIASIFEYDFSQLNVIEIKNRLIE